MPHSLFWDLECIVQMQVLIVMTEYILVSQSRLKNIEKVCAFVLLS